MSQLNLFATTPKGLEYLLVDELKSIGAQHAAEKLAGVEFTGDMELAYKACLWSRLANRILLNLTKVPAATPEELYRGVQTIEWDQHIHHDATFAVHFVTSQSLITHTLFGAQKVKDAIVDHLREKFGTRPDVSKHKPDVSVYVYLHRDTASIYLDLSGESLHKRNYRVDAGAAPLKENLAAAILLRSNWLEISKEQGTLLDPMCGSGTLLIEAALIAGDIAPGLSRDYFGFIGWKKHQPEIWDNLVAEANTRKEQGEKNIPTIIGYDQDPDVISIAFENIDNAGLRGKIHVEKRDLEQFTMPSKAVTGLVITNPPYGERLGEIDELQPLYKQFGDKLKEHFVNWKAAIFTGNPDLGKKIGLRSKKQYALFNGAIPCKLILCDVLPENFVDNSPATENERRIRLAQRVLSAAEIQKAEVLLNRLKKNHKHFSKQAKREERERYCVYDNDLPEYKFVVDIEGDQIYVMEYASPNSVNQKKVTLHRNQMLAVIAEALEVSPQQVFYSIIER